MSEVEKRFHETWLGMVQPVEGLVVSVPVLVEAQCMARQSPEVQQRLIELCPARREGAAGPEGHAIADLESFLSELLGLGADLVDRADALAPELQLYVPEGRQTIRPTLGLRKLDSEGKANAEATGEGTPASRAGERYVALLWDLAEVAGPDGLSLELDKPETKTGAWDYPPAAKFDRLLRHCRVPIGLLTNREVVRLVYAPHGESSGHITFRIEDMASVGGRPILDAFVMLLSATRFFGVAEEHALPTLLAESRKRQANVTNELADQVFDALQILLRGFEAAAERDGRELLDDALAREGDHLYKGLLTVLLRLVFILYAEDRGLMPVGHPLYAEHMSLLALFERLQADHGAHPDSMSRRFGAWGQLVSLFRTVFLGVEAGDLRMPPRRGALFDPNTYPFLEGWGPAGAAPIVLPEHRAAVKLPTVDDETVFRVLEKLLVFEGQRLSYRTLDVEQIGSVYEALMGFHVVRLEERAVCLKPDGVWMTVAGQLPGVTEETLSALAKSRRAKWIKENTGLSKAHADTLAKAFDKGDVADVLRGFAISGRKRERGLTEASAGQLVLQPGAERRRTSSHYTPRSLSAPIVRRTLEPLLAAMGETPSSELLLELKICDPAMGSGAFLVESCRFLADQLIAAWTREGKLGEIAAQAPNEDPLLHARRLVAQRCLYGVDKNESAVELAKLSLWLVTLAKDLPFTFVDHALRHGDSLVGLSFDQIRAFHWTPKKQPSLAERLLSEALDESIAIRKTILELAADGSPEAQREKERLLVDAADASSRARLVADVCVGAFFAGAKDKGREAERERRLALVERWLDGDEEAGDMLRGMQHDIRQRIPVFHWMLEFPEVFYDERQDPLERGKVNRAAFMDAFVGNPPFMGGTEITRHFGSPEYVSWLKNACPEAFTTTDLCAYFLRAALRMLGRHGTVGFILTNSIREGDTRLASLRPALLHGASIIYAVRDAPWPGDAAVRVAVVTIAAGSVAKRAEPVLDGTPVTVINSRLMAAPERDEPVRLRALSGCSFIGTSLGGNGFVLSTDEAEKLLTLEPRSAEVVRQYLGGKDANSSPLVACSRYVITFGSRDIDYAQNFPRALEIVRQRVKPLREQGKDHGPGRHGKKYWWQHTLRADPLYDAISSMERCLVTARVTKHLVFSFQRTDQIFSEQVIVFALQSCTAFAVLQSRIHEPWARLLSSSMKNDLRYAASDCFETFPFPEPDPRAVIPTVEDVGQRLYDVRAAYMIETQQGLTQTYNHLKHPACHDEPIVALRRLHEELDAAVLAAYGWSDLDVPPFCPTTPSEQKGVEAFSDAVIDRLFVLNAERAEDERRRGMGGKKRTKARKRRSTGRKTSQQQPLSFAAQPDEPSEPT